MNVTLCKARDKFKFKKFKKIKFKGHFCPGSFHSNPEDKAQTYEKDLKIYTSNISGESSVEWVCTYRDGQSQALSRIQWGLRKEKSQNKSGAELKRRGFQVAF